MVVEVVDVDNNLAVPSDTHADLTDQFGGNVTAIGLLYKASA